MLNRSHTRNAQANQQQELTPLTPEVAREIEKLLIKNSDAIENLRARYDRVRGTKEIQRNPRITQFSNS